MAWNGGSAVAPVAEMGGQVARLVPLDHHDAKERTHTFAKPMVAGLDLRPSVVAMAKQALVDDLRLLVLVGVEPRADGLERVPSAQSLTVAERLLYWLPEDIVLPTVCIPDDGEITFSWQTNEIEGERWRAVLVVAPDLEVECFVRRCSDQKAAAHFIEDNGSEIIELPVEIENALRAHWQRPTHAAR